MRIFVFVVLIATATAALVVPPAAAQAAGNATATPAGERLNGNVDVLATDYQANESEVAVTFRATRGSETVKLQDLGTVAAAMSGTGEVSSSEIPYREADLSDGERATLTIGVREYRGTVAIAVGAGETWRVERVEEGNMGGSGPFPRDGNQTIALGVGTLLPVVGALVVAWRNNRLTSEGWGYVE